MRMLKGISWLLICISLVCCCSCQESFVSVIQRLDQLEEELFHNKADMIRMEKRIRNIIDAVKTSLRVELKETIRDQVRETMSEIVQGETFRDTVKSEVLSGIRHVRRGYHQMKRQWHHVSRSLKDFQEETATFHAFVLEKVDDCNGQNKNDTCAREKHRLERELQRSNVSVTGLKQDNERLLAINKSCQFQISQMKTGLSVPVSSGTSHHVKFTSTSPAVTKVVTTTRSRLLTTATTTLRPPVKERRILIASIWSSTRQQFRQLNLHNDSLSVYPYHNLANVNCIAYLPKTRELLIAVYSPDRILASTLDATQTRVLKKGVQTLGMAVDEGRGLVFMGTHYPKYSISRMSTEGENFTNVIDLANYGRHPWQITLDTRRRKIYGCNFSKLFTVTYDGKGLSTLATRSDMFSVILDETVGVLYYNNGKELMRMTVSNNVSTRVITLRDIPINMSLYRGIIYYGGWTTAVLGTVNTGSYSLESNTTRGFKYSYVCSIPLFG
ncbi:uncharacterized protein [Haliotis asinina]|uniref:uncharacterized protein n=1 Tax=Haliotis asinina TaxID=109174 RepID=UPI0035320EF6